MCTSSVIQACKYPVRFGACFLWSWRVLAWREVRARVADVVCPVSGVRCPVSGVRCPSPRRRWMVSRVRAPRLASGLVKNLASTRVPRHGSQPRPSPAAQPSPALVNATRVTDPSPAAQPSPGGRECPSPAASTMVCVCVCIPKRIASDIRVDDGVPVRVDDGVPVRVDDGVCLCV